VHCITSFTPPLPWAIKGYCKIGDQDNVLVLQEKFGSQLDQERYRLRPGFNPLPQRWMWWMAGRLVYPYQHRRQIVLGEIFPDLWDANRTRRGLPNQNMGFYEFNFCNFLILLVIKNGQILLKSINSIFDYSIHCHQYDEQFYQLDNLLFHDVNK